MSRKNTKSPSPLQRPIGEFIDKNHTMFEIEKGSDGTTIIVSATLVANYTVGANLFPEKKRGKK